MAKKVVAPPQPRYVRHLKRPEWGVGRVADVYAGLMKVQFTDGEFREFRADVLEVVDEGDLSTEARDSIAAPPPPAAKTAKKKTAAAPKKRAPKAEKA